MKTPPNGRRGATEWLFLGRVEATVVTVVVATEDFELYHDLVGELRDRSVGFTTIEPGEPLPEDVSAVLVGKDDDPGTLPPAVPRVVAEAGDARRAVDETLARLRGVDGRVVVGVDPGDRPGIAVLAGEDVVAAYQVPLADVVAIVEREIEGAPDPVVRIGDGARLQGARIVEALADVRVELVDETGTTPHLGPGARGAGDLLAAANIARREGEPIERRDVEPTAGELQRIKTASRERSGENRAITEALARRVAMGELTIEDALEEHRDG